MTQKSATSCLPVFLVNNKGLVLIITSRIKPEILGHVVNLFLKKRVHVHQVHRFLSEQMRPYGVFRHKKILG